MPGPELAVLDDGFGTPFWQARRQASASGEITATVRSAPSDASDRKHVAEHRTTAVPSTLGRVDFIRVP